MGHVKIDAIVSSPYKRASQMIEGIAKNHNLEVQVVEDADFSLQVGESVNDVQNRAIPVINNLIKKHEGKTIIIRTHGNVMTISMNYYNEKYGYDFWQSTTKPDIYKLIFSSVKLVDVQRLWQE